MERFEGATKVRLKGPHGRYLWAEDDEHNVSQKAEDKNAQAMWRVERSNGGNKAKTLRLKSCFGTYLYACENHHHDISFLAFSGKKVAQMRPENVESSSGFDWEPVIERGALKMKSCFGTFLRANTHAPPWNDSMSHDLPRHQSHQDWLLWKVEIVHVPNITPLELVVGPITFDRVEYEKYPVQEKKSKSSGIVSAKRETTAVQSQTKTTSRPHRY